MQNKNLKLRIIFLAILFCGSFGVVEKSFGATINAASCSQEDVQSSVAEAVAGDTVSIPSGSCAWASAVTWVDKNINVVGAGIGNTVITTDNIAFNITANISPATFRVSSMTIQGTSANIVMMVQSWDANGGNGAPIKGWRFDHLRFDYSSGTVFFVGGVSWGLIDNCTFDSSSRGGYDILGPASMITAEDSASRIRGTYSASLPVNLGSDEAIYIEDCDVNFTSGTTGVADGLYGSRVVIRHNTVHYSYFYTHSARVRDRGAKVIEVYNNIFFGEGFYRPAQIRSGTGVIFNNTITGYELQAFSLDDQRACHIITDPLLGDCNGGSAYDGNIEANGWPCIDQPGRGAGAPGSQTSLPIYIWNNGTTATCATGGACNNSVTFHVDDCALDYIKTSAHSNGNVDLVDNGSTPKSGYVPYPYPHPLRNESSDTAPPTSPTGLAVE